MFVCAAEGMEKTVEERKMVEILIRKEKWDIYVLRNILKLASKCILCG